MSTLEVNKITPAGSGTTVTLGDSGDSIDITSGATVTNFKSTGIDDNADALAITIDSSENVGIGTTSPQRQLHVLKAANNNVNENSLAYLEGIKKGMELVEINNKNPAVMDFEKLISVIKKASKVKPVSISFVTVADMETADDIVQNLSPSPASMSKTNGRVDDDRLKFFLLYYLKHNFQDFQFLLIRITKYQLEKLKVKKDDKIYILFKSTSFDRQAII